MSLSFDHLPFIWNESRDGEEEDCEEFWEGGERVPYGLVLNLADSYGEVDLPDEQESDDEAENVDSVLGPDGGSLRTVR